MNAIHEAREKLAELRQMMRDKDPAAYTYTGLFDAWLGQFCATGFDGDIVQAARDEYCTDEIEIDDRACLSRGEGGCWVSAWVWVESPAPDLLWLCVDCRDTVIDGHCDNTGNHRDHYIKAGIDALQAGGAQLISHDETAPNEFSAAPCACCGAQAAGERHPFELFKA